MLSESALTELAARYRLKPAQYILGLPETQLSIIRWRRVQCNPLQIFTRDAWDSYVVVVHLQPTRARVWSGKREIWSGPIGANTIRLMLPGTKPSWVNNRSFDTLALIIPCMMIEQIAGAESERAHRLLRKFAPLYCRDDVAAGLARSLIEALRRQRPFSTVFIEALGRAMVAHLLGRYTGAIDVSLQHELTQHALQRVREYIAVHLSENIRVRDLAAVAGMSESHFAHCFCAATGLSPHRFVTAARLDLAQARLREGSSPLLDIAFDCGFKGASHFSHVYKKFVGCSPHTFRKSVNSVVLRSA